MGLSISVGVLADFLRPDREDEWDEEEVGSSLVETVEWFRGELQTVYRVLAEAGVPSFTEPETLAEEPNLWRDSFPYSTLHYLRRAYALQQTGQPLTPAGDKLSQPDWDLINAVSTAGFDSHLICHADYAGYYAPVDFPRPLCDDALTGNILGSSPRLLAELVTLAPFLGITLTPSGEWTDAGYEAWDHMIRDEAAPYGAEYIIWRTLYEAARFSVAHQTMIEFA